MRIKTQSHKQCSQFPPTAVCLQHKYELIMKESPAGFTFRWRSTYCSISGGAIIQLHDALLNKMDSLNLI